MPESNRPKSISLSSVKSPFRDDSRYLVIPGDLHHDFQPCAGLVQSHSGSGAWLSPEDSEQSFPPVGDLLLIKGEPLLDDLGEGGKDFKFDASFSNTP